MPEIQIGSTQVTQTSRRGIVQYALNDIRIYRIKVESIPKFFTNVYLILDEEVSLVDAGSNMNKAMSDLKEGIAIINQDFGEDVGFGDIANIVITHGHGDHFGMVLASEELQGKKIYVHHSDSVHVKDYDFVYNQWRRNLSELAREVRLPYDPVGEDHWAEPARLPFRPKDQDVIEVSDGQEIINGYKVIHTPGHSSGHICLQVGPVLFLGDHILSSTTPHQFPRNEQQGTGLGTYLASLKKIESLGETLGLAGHEGTVYPVNQRARAIDLFHQQRLREIVELCRKEINLYQITDEYYRQHPKLIGAPSIDNLGDEEKLGAIEEIKAHVEYLLENHTITLSSMNNGVASYCIL
ncbi:MAG: MBL fold metallo-hydrolase [Dehalococcoidia bacterium]|nr:MBL fold metallo-hydrolase [Dehalococcoidia bacterium]